eukprot:6172369-Pleurochrysis_carterae.AAC.2
MHEPKRACTKLSVHARAYACMHEPKRACALKCKDAGMRIHAAPLKPRAGRSYSPRRVRSSQEQHAGHRPRSESAHKRCTGAEHASDAGLALLLNC